MSSIEVKNLHVSYYGKEVIRNVHFSTNNGRLVGILGPNGAGKSTLMKAMLDLIPKDRGSVTFQGQSIKAFRKEIAYVPQRNDIDWNFPIVVEDVVLLGTYPKLGVFRRPKNKEKEIAQICLKEVGMEAFKNEQIGELSGGQQQRIFLARSLAQRANYFFLDEPFAGIDAASEEIIIRILKRLRDEGKLVFVVHHDLTKVKDYFDDVLLINKKLIAYGPTEEVFKTEIISKTYHQQFSLLEEIGAGQ